MGWDCWKVFIFIVMLEFLEWKGILVRDLGAGFHWRILLFVCLILSELEIGGCKRLQQLLLFSQLWYLKVFYMVCLDNLEYIEVISRDDVVGDGIVVSVCSSSGGSDYD